MQRLLAICVLVLAFVTVGENGSAVAQSASGTQAAASPSSDPVFRPIRTDSPRDTLQTFLRIGGELSDAMVKYRTDRSAELTRKLALLSEQVVALIDLSAVPGAARRKRGTETAMVLLDVFGRIPPPPLQAAPDAEAVGDLQGPVSWRIPQTPIRISLIQEGARQGEFLFSARTVHDAPRFLRGIVDRPLTPKMPFDTWTDMSKQITGPLIPMWIARPLPVSLHAFWLDTPAWKVVLMILVDVIVVVGVGLLTWGVRRIAPQDRLGALIVRMAAPVTVLVAASLFIPIVALNINLSGRAAGIEEFSRTIAIYAAWAWLFWIAVRAVFEAVIKSPRIADTSYDAGMLRLISGILGVIGVVLIVAYGGQQLGLPVLSLLAGLGIGGLAVALAIRPTLENLIGGFVLFIDKPVQVGDFCSFGGQTGTVERIGIRSTQLRALDRTQISIPNAQFADMQLINWARCDQMLIQETVGLRYETSPDQLRFLLTKVREMLHSHPRIDPQTVRVRFEGYGDSALNVGIRIYAKTREWNDFFAIREDVFLRIYDIVNGAGSGFAFPSQTVYMGKDGGLDETARDAAEQQVQAWRRSGQLPFPRLSEKRQEALAGTLDYPPKGSLEAGGEVVPASEAERLSSEPADEIVEQDQKNPTGRGGV